ncbi:MAG: universal stress protein [Oceanidesulfovibrio sp.]
MGYAPLKILEYAEEAGTDAIVIGSHGRRGMDRIVFGSVAEKVIKSSRCPCSPFRSAPHRSDLLERASPAAVHHVRPMPFGHAPAPRKGNGQRLAPRQNTARKGNDRQRPRDVPGRTVEAGSP